MTRQALRLRLTTIALLTSFMGALEACSSSTGALGSDCLRDDDCAVGVCFSLKCRLPPTNANARLSGGANAFTPPTAPAPDAGTVDASAPEPGSQDAGTPAAHDAGTPDAVHDASSGDAG